MCRWLATRGARAPGGPSSPKNSSSCRASTADGRDDRQRRRFRRRLVRRRALPRRLPQHRAGVERPQPARAVLAGPVTAGVRTSGRRPGPRCSSPTATRSGTTSGSGCTTARSPASRRSAGARDGGRPRPLRAAGGVDGPGDAVLPRADLRVGCGTTPRGGGRVRSVSSRTPAVRHGIDEPVQMICRDHGRHDDLGLPLLQRPRVAVVVPQHRRVHAQAPVPRQPGAAPALRRRPPRGLEPLGDLQGAWRERSPSRRTSSCTGRGGPDAVRSRSARSRRMVPASWDQVSPRAHGDRPYNGGTPDPGAPSPPQSPGSSPGPRRVLALVAYLAVFYGVWILNGIDYDHVGDPPTPS